LGKGGIISIYNPSGVVGNDYGWRKKLQNKIAVTHWQNNQYECRYLDTDGKVKLTVNGNFSLHSYLRPSPVKHAVLRLLSFMLGNRIINRLKSVLIFNQKKTRLAFSRKIFFENSQLKIEDHFTPTKIHGLYRAPHYSIRHVSSAGRFVEEELILPPAMSPQEKSFVRTIKL
jgi:hypothetical protein